jgi:hypothetical protein
VADANPSTGIADAWLATMLAPSKAAKAKTVILRLAIQLLLFSFCRLRNRPPAENSHMGDVGMLKIALANINPRCLAQGHLKAGSARRSSNICVIVT